MFRRFRSLRKKLICSVLLTLSIPIIIVVVIAQVRSQSAIRAQAKNLNENLLEMGIHQMDATWEGLDNVYRSIYLNEAFREYLLHYGQQTGPNAAASESDLLKRVFLSSLSSRADLYSIIFVDNSGRLTYATREESGSVPEYADAALPDAYLTCLEPDQMNRLTASCSRPVYICRSIRSETVRANMFMRLHGKSSIQSSILSKSGRCLSR